MTRHTLLSLFLLAALFCGVRSAYGQAAQPPVVRPPVTAIRAGKLVDPEQGTVQENVVILVRGRTIADVGPDVKVPEGAAVIDLSKSTVLPGLIDCHTHLCYTKGHREFSNVRDFQASILGATVLKSTAYRAIEGVNNARQMLEAGFTTVRDLGNAGNYADTDLRMAISAGVVPGPTMISAGRIIAPYGGQLADVIPSERRDLGTPEYFFADTRDELKKAIRENIFHGARVIKIVVDDQPYIYSQEDIEFIVREAADADVKVAAHCVTAKGARNAAAAGVASIEHGLDMPDDVLALAKEKGVVLVGTDMTAEYATLHVGGPGLHDVFVERLRRAHAAGVTLAFGSDVNVPMRGKTRGEVAVSFVQSFVEAGVPAKTALQAMTVNGARLLGVERGVLRKDATADLIAVPEDPLQNIRALEKVSFVMKNGRVVRGG